MINGVNFKPLDMNESFNYECSMCGDCCRNIKQTVLLDSLDLFKLSKSLNMLIEDVVLNYTDTVYLVEGFPFLMLKTKVNMDSCVFLKAGKCSINKDKPKTCKLYPMAVEVNERDKNQLNFLLSYDRHSIKHFKGVTYLVKDWDTLCLSKEDKAFILKDYNTFTELAKLWSKIKQESESDMMRSILFYKYLNFDMNKNFLEQYIHNMNSLKSQLNRMIKI